MKFTFFCESGSPSFLFTPDDIFGRGLGGAELSLVGLTEELAHRHEQVTVYNQPPVEGVFNGVEYLDTARFDQKEPTDVFVLFRNPSPRLYDVNARVKLWWSCDQQSAGDYGRDIIPFVNHTICISEYHRDYHIKRYGVDPSRVTAIDLGVRTWEYQKALKKQPKRLLYCSIPARGLEFLPHLFENIRWFHPDAELYITSDYSIWGYGIPPNNECWKMLFKDMAGVHFLGKVPRAKLVELQLTSDILAYPNKPDGEFAELFGVSLAEAQCAGCVPVTSRFGAFPTTVIRPEGVLIDGDPRDPESEYGMDFVAKIVELLSNRGDLEKRQNALRAKALTRFNWNGVVDQWLQTIHSLMP